MLLLGAKTKRAVLLFPRQTDDRFEKRPAPQPHYRRRAFQSQKQIVTSRGTQQSGAVQEPVLVFDASQRHGEAAYVPDKHSTFIRSRFVLVSKSGTFLIRLPLTSAASRPILMRDITFMRPVHSGNKRKDWCDPERCSSLGRSERSKYS